MNIAVERYVEAVTNITEETGYPPTTDELCDVFGMRKAWLTNSRAHRYALKRGLLAWSDGRLTPTTTNAKRSSPASSSSRVAEREEMSA